MKTNLLNAVAALGVVVALVATQKASAELIVQTNGSFQLVASDPVPVGVSAEGLVRVFLSARYTGPVNADSFPNSFDGTIAANGALHHDQTPAAFPPGTFTRTPLLSNFFGLGDSIDSHFLMDPRVTVTAPTEPLVAAGTSVEPSLYGGRTGYGGPLSASVGFFDGGNPPTNASMPIAQLVFKPTSAITYDFLIGTGTVGQGARFQGQFIIPEPATLSLLGLAMIGIAGVRRRRS